MGSPAKRQAVLDAGHDVTVISRDNMGQVEPGWFKTLVIDELSLFKNASRKAKGYKVIRRLAEACPHVWGLTGTPAPNGYPDLWGQLYLIDRGVRLHRTQGAFHERWFYPEKRLPSGVVTKWSPREGARGEIDERLADICLSMEAKDYLDLPEPTINEVRVELPPAVREQYNAMKKTFVLRLEDEGQAYSAATAAAAQNKLAQITAGFVYPDADEAEEVPTAELHDLKFKAAAEVVEGTGSPVLMFYRFKHELAKLTKEIPEARLASDPGVIEEFRAGRVPVMLAHPRSMGYGLNLQEHCHTVVWTTLPWALDEYSQANARVDRQGQTQPVVIHMIIAADTVDEVTLAALEAKDEVQTALMMALSRRSG